MRYKNIILRCSLKNQGFLCKLYFIYTPILGWLISIAILLRKKVFIIKFL